MAIIWDKAKAARLFQTRQISLAEIADLLLERRYLAILENPSHPERMVFVLPYKNYTHVVPLVVDKPKRCKKTRKSITPTLPSPLRGGGLGWGGERHRRRSSVTMVKIGFPLCLRGPKQYFRIFLCNY